MAEPENTPAVARREGGKFAPGVSGNPGGRPKGVAEVQAMAREHTAKALQTLVTIADNEEANPAARVSAAQAILDRGWGKPVQPNEHSGPGGGPLRLTWGDGTP